MARHLITLLCSLLFFHTGMAQESYVATYKLLVGPVTVGEMVRSFRMQPDRTYRFESKLYSTGLASLIRKDELFETSSGIFQQAKFHPRIYTHVRKNKKKPLNLRMDFDRDNAHVDTISNGVKSSSPLDEDMLDKLIYQAAVMHDLSIGKTELRYRIIDRGKEKSYQPILGEETVIRTKLGRFTAREIIRRRTGDKRRTIFWCAPELGYLPIKVSYREKNGTETIALLTDYRRLDKSERP